MVFILFDFILNIPVNKRRIKLAGVAEGPDPLPGKSETFGAL